MKTVICFLVLTFTLHSNTVDASDPMVEAGALLANRISLEENGIAPEPSLSREDQNNIAIEIHQKSQEIPPILSSAEFSNYDYTSKKFLYGTLAIIPGGGVSHRSRNGLRGSALDWKIGVLPFIFDTRSFIPVLSCDYNRLHFFKAKGTSPYLSYGIGAAYIVPYIPLRAGIEFEHGFIDIGAKLVYIPWRTVLPSPEIRAGMDLKF